MPEPLSSNFRNPPIQIQFPFQQYWKTNQTKSKRSILTQTNEINTNTSVDRKQRECIDRLAVTDNAYWEAVPNDGLNRYFECSYIFWI